MEFLDVEDPNTREPESTVATGTVHLQVKVDITSELAYALAELILHAQAMFPDDPNRNPHE